MVNCSHLRESARELRERCGQMKHPANTVFKTSSRGQQRCIYTKLRWNPARSNSSSTSSICSSHNSSASTSTPEQVFGAEKPLGFKKKQQLRDTTHTQVCMYLYLYSARNSTARTTCLPDSRDTRESSAQYTFCDAGTTAFVGATHAVFGQEMSPAAA